MHDPLISNRFCRGEVVFKITAVSVNDPVVERDIHMVTTNDRYEEQIGSHQYTPLLFVVPLPVRLAYLYECLNRRFEKPRSEYFVFWWRTIGDVTWDKWFTVDPYVECHVNGALSIV